MPAVTRGAERPYDSSRIHPMIHSSAFIAPDIELGAGVSVGPFAVIEGPGRIGDGCRMVSDGERSGLPGDDQRDRVGGGH